MRAGCGGKNMITYFPSLYPDELFYSAASRYLSHTASLNIDAITDIYSSRVRPDMEFINNLNDIARSVITKQKTIDEIILNHTMYPYFRFASKDRLLKAHQCLIDGGEDIHNILPFPKSIEKLYLKYCPVCAEHDRKCYGETYWHRLHNIRGVEVCPQHKCRLLKTNIEISGKQSPRLYVAEHEVRYSEVIPADQNEVDFARYMTDVFNSEFVPNNEIDIGDFLVSKLENTPYISIGGKRKHITRLYEDLVNFYSRMNIQCNMQPYHLQKIFMGYHTDFYMICLLGYFLKIPASELTNPTISNSQSNKFNEKVMELCSSGMSYNKIASLLGCSSATVRNTNKPKPKKKHDYSVRKGMQKHDWAKMDDQLLQEVKNVCVSIYNSPARVTEAAVRKVMCLPDKRFNYLPQCKDVISQYTEPYEKFWARKIVCCYDTLRNNSIENEIYWRHIRDLTNLKKDNFIKALPYLDLYTDCDTANAIKKLVGADVEKCTAVDI